MGRVEFMDPALAGRSVIEAEDLDLETVEFNGLWSDRPGGAVEFRHAGRVVIVHGEDLTEDDIDGVADAILDAAEEDMANATYH